MSHVPEVWPSRRARPFLGHESQTKSTMDTPSMDKLTCTGVIVREEGAYSALCPELDVASVGATPPEAKAMLLEAVALHIEGAIEDGLPYLRPVPPQADPRTATPDAVVEVFPFRAEALLREE